LNKDFIANNQNALDNLRKQINDKNVEKLCDLTLELSCYIEWLEARISQLEDKNSVTTDE